MQPTPRRLQNSILLPKLYHVWKESALNDGSLSRFPCRRIYALKPHKLVLFSRLLIEVLQLGLGFFSLLGYFFLFVFEWETSKSCVDAVFYANGCYAQCAPWSNLPAPLSPTTSPFAPHGGGLFFDTYNIPKIT